MQRQKNLNYKLFIWLFAGILITCMGWLIHSLESIPLSSDSQLIELYDNQSFNLHRAYKNALQQAQKSILMIIFALTDEQIIKSLKAKSEQGVQVTVICDAKASPHIDARLGSKITIKKRFGKGLMHLKLLVIDDSQVWIGSANMTGESLDFHGNLVIMLNNKGLAQLITKKANTMPEYGYGEDIPYYPFTIGNQKVEFWLLPDNPEGSLRIKQLIRSAKKTVKVAMYTWTRQDFAKEIIKAKERGVHVEVILDQSSSKGASLYIAEMLKEHGIPLYLNRGPSLLHYKFLYIDDTILENGSANWTKAAFNKNEDCFIIINTLTHKQHQEMEHLWEMIKADAIPANTVVPIER